jgi:heme oxygenase
MKQMATAPATSVMQRLRDETAEHHRRAEAKPLEQMLINGRPDVRAYTALLSQRLVLHTALESHVERLAARDTRVRDIVPPTLFQRDNLLRDLAHFGLAEGGRAALALPATVQLVAEIERTAADEPLALLGYYYVLEGSKNGARFIAQRIGPLLGLASGAPGLLYFDPHGPAQRELWQSFKQRMDAAGFAGSEIDGMVATAQRMFDGIAALDDEICAALPA